MKREDGRKLFRAFLGNSRETAGEQRAMMEQMAAPSRERSLRSMMEHLLSLDETAWYLYAWSRDPLEGRFSREQKLAYGFRAAECGRSEAQLILGKTDVWDIAARMGLKVLTPQVPGGGGHVIFAQYEEPDSITIFMDGAERAQKLIREEKLEGLLGNRAVEDVLLAHELFHVTEYRKRDCIFTQTEKVELWKKPFSNRSRILRDCGHGVCPLPDRNHLHPICPGCADDVRLRQRGGHGPLRRNRGVCRKRRRKGRLTC